TAASTTSSSTATPPASTPPSPPTRRCETASTWPVAPTGGRLKRMAPVDTPTPDPTTRPDARAPTATAPTAEAEPDAPRLGGPRGEAGLDPYATRGETSLVPVVVAQGTEDLFHRIGTQSR